MSIYLYLCHQTQKFEELSDQLPLTLLELTIDHHEGRIPIANLIVPVQQDIPDTGWAYIATDDRGVLEAIFRGQFTGGAKLLDDQTKHISLLASACNMGQTIEKLKGKNKDNYFVNSGSLTDLLEFTQDIPCYGRLGEEFKLSNIFKGRNIKRLQHEILADTFKMQITDTPLPGIDVTVIKEWTQVCQGEVNLYPRIEVLFPHGRMCTLSPSGLLASWPKTGQMFGRSGYAVVQSHLQTIDPQKTGVLGVYPEITPEINGKKYKIFWLQGKLVIEWSYRQKRREIVQFTLEHKNKFLNQQRPNRKLKLSLAKRGESSNKSSFFDSEKGVSALKQALEIAKSHLAYSARALEITFQIPFTDALDLTLDDSIEVNHPSIPSNTAVGKIVSYRLERAYDRAVAHLKILIATGVSENTNQQINLEALSKVEGVSGRHDLGPDDIIDHISIHNHAFDQIEFLQVAADESHPTWIDLRLKDLRSHDVLQRDYVMQGLSWSVSSLEEEARVKKGIQ